MPHKKDSSVKVPAATEKVQVVLNCLAKYVEAHLLPPTGAPAEIRLAAGRKHLRCYFTEAGRCSKRAKAEKAGLANKEQFANGRPGGPAVTVAATVGLDLGDLLQPSQMN
ncbi:hypothetical protein MRX96_034613 [Rhipicephalus microplus]